LGFYHGTIVGVKSARILELHLFYFNLNMQTTHHPPTPHTILTNHTPSISSPYLSLALRVNVQPQPNIFPIPLNNTHVKLSPFSTLLPLIVAHDQTP